MLRLPAVGAVLFALAALALPSLASPQRRADIERVSEAKLIVLDPGHFHAALVQKALELVANRLASLLRAAPLRIAGFAPVHADEDVLFVVRLGHRRILYNPPTRRAHRQGHVLAAGDERRSLSTPD